MKDHVLSRLQGNSGAGEETEYTAEERNRLFFQHEWIYRHSVLRINYTTYDVCREQDLINPQTPKRFVMVYSNEDRGDSSAPKHPFWYAEILGIFHVNICLDTLNGFTPYKPMDFLWVRWLGLDPNQGGRSKDIAGELDWVGYVPSDDPEAFGFLDPDCVVRAAHLIPAFKNGRTINLCPPSVARDPEGDWEYFYVNRYVSLLRICILCYWVSRFVDRDMFMWYLGAGVGHIMPRGHELNLINLRGSMADSGDAELEVPDDSGTGSSVDEISSINTDTSEDFFSELERDEIEEGVEEEEEEALSDEAEMDQSDLDEPDIF